MTSQLTELLELLPSLLKFLIFLPILGFIVTLLIPKNMENAISKVAISTVGLHLVCSWVFMVLWLFDGSRTYETRDFILYDSETYQFFIAFYIDQITAVYLLLGSLLTLLVTIYCSYYLHRENGYKRFFNTILFFYIGYNIVIFSGNFETLFIGWEILGICSFLLIGFYRERFLPVKNALKVFTVFRVADLGILLTIWLSHHLWHENITFTKLSDSQLVAAQLQEYSLVGIVMALMIVMAASVKSAQIPFSSWMPRAMEGPTPSSAIFYGSLSVHLGAFLLMRTAPLWEQYTSIVWLIIFIGLTTSIMATVISRVQSSIKAQIAYSSVAQIGIIFIEIALGFHSIALIHLSGNALLRTYQLLVSPSVVSYLIREQFYNFIPRKFADTHSSLKRLKYSIYILALKEFHLDSFMYIVLWNPMKYIGRKMSFVPDYLAETLVLGSYFIGVICVFSKDSIPIQIYHYFPPLFAFIGLLFVLRAFTERKSAQLSWMLVVINHLWVALAISFYDEVTRTEIAIYLSGVITAGIIGNACLARLVELENTINWNDFQGHVYEHPNLAFVFLLCCLGLMAFPISPSFLGVDLVFSHIQTNQVDFAIILAFSYILVGLSLVRMYSRIFLGPHIKNYHHVPGKHS